MTSTKTKIILVLLFLLTVIGLPTVCVFIPYQEPYFVEETTDIYIFENDNGGEDYYLIGEFKNPSIVKITGLKYEISFYDDFGEYLGYFASTEEVNIGRCSSIEIIRGFIPPQGYISYWQIENIEIEYTTLAPWFYYMIGGAVFGITCLFFTRKKLYFDIEKHKIVVLAGIAKASLMVDGKIYKTIELKSKREKAQYKLKVSGKILTLDFKWGSVFPDVTVTVDGVVPKFNKIQQHAFLKMKEEKTERVVTENKNNAAPIAGAEKKEAALNPKMEKKSKAEQLEDLYKAGVISKDEFDTYKNMFKD